MVLEAYLIVRLPMLLTSVMEEIQVILIFAVFWQLLVETDTRNGTKTVMITTQLIPMDAHRHAKWKMDLDALERCLLDVWSLVETISLQDMKHAMTGILLAMMDAHHVLKNLDGPVQSIQESQPVYRFVEILIL